MKPKNRFFCSECHRRKLLFESEKKALNFIRFNADEIFKESGRAPNRAYYCDSCGGYHVTSSKKFNNVEKKC